MYRRLLEYQQKYSNAQSMPNPKASCSHFIPRYIIRQYFPGFFFFFLNWYQNREDWSVMGRQKFSNLRNRYMIKILMIRIFL